MARDKSFVSPISNESFSIVIVDDLPDNLRLLSGILKEKGYRVRPASSGKRALATIRKERPELILLDIMMPEMDGYEVCRELKADNLTCDIPVIFLSALNEVFDKVKAFQAGGVDYICKPFQVEEVLVRVHTHLTIRTQQLVLGRQNQELKEKNRLITKQSEQLKQLACRDFLTGLSNRRDFLDKAGKEEGRFRRSGLTFSVLLLDIDRFKAVNDTYGHECGDQVLVHVAKRLDQVLRQQDTVARWGGEEFICLLPESELKGAVVVAEKIRQSFEEHEKRCGEVVVSITVTLGVCWYDGSCSLEETIRRADAALYKGKEKGRNRVEVAQEFTPEGGLLTASQAGDYGTR